MNRLTAILAALPALAVVSLAAPASAQVAFRPAVERAVDGVIVPGYAALAEAAGAEATAMNALCRAPSPPEALTRARAGFADLVTAFGRVEVYRFGPARENNRFERLFFWPDRRGRGLAQVQGILAEEDETATNLDTLRDKSVAVQGLLALDFILSGDGNETLMDAGSFRCRYGAAVAAAIALHADEILAGWQEPDGFAAVMKAADGNLYRSHGEVVQELVKAAAEQLQITGDFKLGNVVGETPADARPRLAPFWRSGLALQAMEANIDGVAALGEALSAALPADEAEMGGAFAFELRQARAALAYAAADGRPLADLLADPAMHKRLAYAASPISGAFRVLDDRMPGAMGLTLGFNSLDGD
ncbi:imelysin family protein [Acuticoccus yangtzensis]|uniref:imelysin family protein n=1 Tax=Acuticoccus yangtzensis TaxID=1443441 RepID=UPI00094978D5|nr:imelysin family protein [Acuticoccus yangtzensis]